MRAVRAFNHLRLLLDVGGGKAERGRRGNRGVEMLVGEFGPVAELSRGAGARPAVSTLIPDTHESRPPAIVEEVGMREVEPLHVDDPNEDVLPIAMGRRAAKAP